MKVNLRSGVIFFASLLPWLEREKKQITEIEGEGMIAGYMKVRFEAKVTRGFSLSPRRFRDLLSPLCGFLLISFAKKNQEKPLGPG